MMDVLPLSALVVDFETAARTEGDLSEKNVPGRSHATSDRGVSRIVAASPF